MLNLDCIFCKIVNGEIPADVVYEDDLMMAFRDLNPVSPQHVLLIPKKHIVSLNDVQSEDHKLVGHMICKVKEIAETLGIESGYRLVSNCGEDGGQTVGHLHFHLGGGRKFTWPPG